MRSCNFATFALIPQRVIHDDEKKRGRNRDLVNLNVVSEENCCSAWSRILQKLLHRFPQISVEGWDVGKDRASKSLVEIKDFLSTHFRRFHTNFNKKYDMYLGFDIWRCVVRCRFRKKHDFTFHAWAVDLYIVSIYYKEKNSCLCSGCFCFYLRFNLKGKINARTHTTSI